MLTFIGTLFHTLMVEIDSWLYYFVPTTPSNWNSNFPAQPTALCVIFARSRISPKWNDLKIDQMQKNNPKPGIIHLFRMSDFCEKYTNVSQIINFKVISKLKDKFTYGRNRLIIIFFYLLLLEHDIIFVIIFLCFLDFLHYISLKINEF